MSPALELVVFMVILIGHFGVMLAGYNRVNALGYHRRKIKAAVKVMALFTVLFPMFAGWWCYEPLVQWLAGRGTLDSFPLWARLYAAGCLLVWPVFGIPWLLYRPLFGLEWVKTKRQIEVVKVQNVVENPLPMNLPCRLLSKVPLNQLFDLSIDTIELPVAHLPAALDGYRIAHLSDIHLTGDVHPDFSRYVVQRATQWRPELMILSGDIIDHRPCITWLGDIFSQAHALDGCYYVLGNHDTKVADSQLTRAAMDDAGWTDLGSHTVAKPLRGVDSLIIGNEYPWYGRPNLDQDGEDSFRLLVSHSPDQIQWARRRNVTLMLAGHTHGGQGRLPLIGPLLSPSRYGSRFASGDFYKTPTTMHVTRGLAGTHLARINCRPQLSQLVLRCVAAD